MRSKITPYLFLFLLISFFNTFDCFSQNERLSFHSRVNLNQKEVKEIAQLWENYLFSEPEKTLDSPYWNFEEKNKYKDYDFSLKYLFQFPSSQLLSYYKPKVLSIEKEGNSYLIRTLFEAENIPDSYKKSNPWAITKIYVIKENGNWRLKNTLSETTKNWHRKTIGKITYIYPPQYKFNENIAKKAVNFCNQKAAFLGIQNWEPFDYYLTYNGDQMGNLINFDFFFAGYTTGISMKKNHILLSGIASEYYPHEFIHMILPPFERHPFIEEGIATWLGGTNNQSFEEVSKRLAQEIDLHPEIQFQDILSKKWGWELNAYYTTGAILSKAAYEKLPPLAFQQFYNLSSSDEELISKLCKVLKMTEEEFHVFWKKEVLKFL